MATLTLITYRYYGALTALSVCLNVILLITVLRQAFHGLKDVPRSLTTVRTESWSAIRSTGESLYTMYGEGEAVDLIILISHYYTLTAY